MLNAEFYSYDAKYIDDDGAVIEIPAKNLLKTEIKKLQNIARFKRPKHYHFIDTLPTNNYGKVLKTELRILVSALDVEAQCSVAGK